MAEKIIETGPVHAVDRWRRAIERLRSWLRDGRAQSASLPDAGPGRLGSR